MVEIAAIAKAVVELIPVFTALVKLFKDAKQRGWIKDGQELRKKIQEASTEDERIALARQLFEHRPR